MKRRDFLKKGGILATAATLPGIMTAKVERKENETLKKHEINIGGHWDVIVVGGGPSGCAAATAAAREGAKTLLIEGTGALGGMGTSGLLNAWCPFTDKEKSSIKELQRKSLWKHAKGCRTYMVMIGYPLIPNT